MKKGASKGVVNWNLLPRPMPNRALWPDTKQHFNLHGIIILEFAYIFIQNSFTFQFTCFFYLFYTCFKAEFRIMFQFPNSSIYNRTISIQISIYNLNPRETFDFQDLRLRFVNPGNFNLQTLRFLFTKPRNWQKFCKLKLKIF